MSAGTWRVPLVNPRGGRRQRIEVEAETAREAVVAAREQSRLKYSLLDPAWAEENGLLDGMGVES